MEGKPKFPKLLYDFQAVISHPGYQTKTSVHFQNIIPVLYVSNP